MSKDSSQLAQDSNKQDSSNLLSFSSLLLTISLLIFGTGLQATLLGLRATLEYMSTQDIGLIMSAYFVGFGIGSWVVPQLIGSVGHIRTFAALASISSATALGYILYIHPLHWLILRLLQGACYGGMIVVAESWLQGSAKSSHRGAL